MSFPIYVANVLFVRRMQLNFLLYDIWENNFGPVGHLIQSLRVGTFKTKNIDHRRIETCAMFCLPIQKKKSIAIKVLFPFLFDFSVIVTVYLAKLSFLT